MSGLVGLDSIHGNVCVLQFNASRIEYLRDQDEIVTVIISRRNGFVYLDVHSISYPFEIRC